MGFSKQQAESALRQYGTVQQALDSLLAGVGEKHAVLKFTLLLSLITFFSGNITILT